jgi:hypothetical protein
MIQNKEIKKLKNCARHFALRMDDSDIETVIVEFVEVKLLRDKSRIKKIKCQKNINPRPR